MATVPAKMIHPALLRAFGHGPCLPRQPRDGCMVDTHGLADCPAAVIGGVGA